MKREASPFCTQERFLKSARAGFDATRGLLVVGGDEVGVLGVLLLGGKALQRPKTRRQHVRRGETRQKKGAHGVGEGGGAGGASAGDDVASIDLDEVCVRVKVSLVL